MALNALNFNTPVSKFKMKHANPALMKSPSLNLPESPLLQKLGYGTGVQVYLYERPQKNNFCRSPWAVKKVNKSGKINSSLYEKRLKEEAKILQGLNHKHIISFRATLKSPTGNGTCLAMEFGDVALFDMIEERMETFLGSFPAINILKVLHDMSDALSYLHNEKLILHGDMKSGNILVKGNFDNTKLCDFGVCVKLDKNLKGISPYIGTNAWSALEVHNGGEITDRTEIFSLGMVIYEMLTLNVPYGHIFPMEEDFENTEDFDKACESADEEYEETLGTRPSLPDIPYGESYDTVIELLYACTDEKAGNRPCARDLFDILQEVNYSDPKAKLNFQDD